MSRSAQLKELCLREMLGQHFDCLAVGVVDFNHDRTKVWEFENGSYSSKPRLWFDLASVTKVLTLASTYISSPKLFDDDLVLLLNHQGGIPAWGRLGKSDWKERILSYPIKEAQTLYSDFGALRLQLELQKKAGKHLYETCSSFWDQELCSWLDLPQTAVSPITGFRRGRPIRGQVHDDNAFIIGERLSHAGLFATISGLCRTLLNLNNQFDFVAKIKRAYDDTAYDRFIYGWDRVLETSSPLAGEGCGPRTFGHLGFTGTSVWIDADLNIASVILTNATRDFWHHRKDLNRLRKSVGEFIWQNFSKGLG